MERLLPLLVLTLVSLPAMTSCGDSGNAGCTTDHRQQSRYASVRELLSHDTASADNEDLPMPDGPIKRMKVNYFGNFGKAFGDSNYIHWAAADSIGIVPLSDSRSHWQMRRPIVRISSCEDYFVENLTYSVPYLVPEAAAMLHEIGSRFNDSLQARGGGKYRIRVTSVLRTPESVRKLRRRNRNAVDSSVHQLGTTMDISYAKFVPSRDNDVVRSIDDLKGVLGEILKDMREQGKCYVKYERKQPCFHITVRPGAYSDHINK